MRIGNYECKESFGIEVNRVKGVRSPWFLGIGLHEYYGEYYLLINLLKIQLKIGWINKIKEVSE